MSASPPKTPSQTGSSHRPITLRARRDLIISLTRFQDEDSWIVKDPISLKYHRLREAEYEVLRLLDGDHSYVDLKRHLAKRFPSKKVAIRQIQHLVQSFHQSGLLLSDMAGQAEPLIKRHMKETRRKRLQWMTSLISIRFPGIDPEPLLVWLYPRVRWAFTPGGLACWLVVVSAALLLVGSNFSEFQSKLPDFQQFFGVNNLLYMGVVLILTKSIHELGHGLCCKHFHGECHEIGLMLMVLTPAMYCDTSDSWILPNKWHRIAIGAAGMWIEVGMAAVATFVWWNTHPGWIHYLCLNVMFLCSVATIVFNINPLLRYDGYYMLSDFMEIPNLSRQSQLALTDRLRVWCLGMKPIPTERLPTKNQGTFALYSVCSLFYRWFVMVMIFWFLSKVAEPYGLQAIANIVVLVTIAGMVLRPIYSAGKFLLFPGRFREVKLARLGLTCGVLAAIAAACCLVPIPHYVLSDFVLRPADAERIYVKWPGNLAEIHAAHGDVVAAGDTIALLQNRDLDIAIEELQSEYDRHIALMHAYRMDDHDPLQSARMAGESRAALVRLQKQLDERHQQREHLLLISQRGGTILPPPAISEHGSAGPLLPKWSGTPLSPENRMGFLQRETLLCYVGDPHALRATLTVPQEDLKFLVPEQPVQLEIHSFRGHRIAGRLERISNQPLRQLPQELSQTNGGTIAAEAQPTGFESPMITLFEASVQFTAKDLTLLPGMKGRAKILVGSAPLANRLYRWLATVIKFR